jgi:hypothetical protein
MNHVTALTDRLSLLEQRSAVTTPPVSDEHSQEA